MTIDLIIDYIAAGTGGKSLWQAEGYSVPRIGDYVCHYDEDENGNFADHWGEGVVVAVIWSMSNILREGLETQQVSVYFKPISRSILDKLDGRELAE